MCEDNEDGEDASGWIEQELECKRKNPAFEPDLWSMASLTFCINLRMSSCSVRPLRCCPLQYSLPMLSGVGAGGDIWRHIGGIEHGK